MQKAPGNADAWAMLALLCANEYGQGFEFRTIRWRAGYRRAPRRRGRAIESLAHFGLAQVLFFQKEIPAFRNAAERAAALNPMDGNSIAFLGSC